MLAIGTEDAEHYYYNYIAGATFNRTNLRIISTALYNPTRATYTLPIAVNLLTNTVLKALAGMTLSIRFAVQEFPREQDEYLIIQEANLGTREAYLIVLIIVLFFFPLTALFVIHPMGEQLSNFKHLQRMAGASLPKYWGTMFTFDYTIYLGLCFFFIIGFVVIDCFLGLMIIGGLEFCKYL